MVTFIPERSKAWSPSKTMLGTLPTTLCEHCVPKRYVQGPAGFIPMILSQFLSVCGHNNLLSLLNQILRHIMEPFIIEIVLFRVGYFILLECVLSLAIIHSAVLRPPADEAEFLP